MLRPAPWRVLAVLGVVLLPWWVSNAQPMLWPDDYSAHRGAGRGARCGQLPDGAWVISDDPGFAWRAGHRVPGEFVDVSMKRFQQGALTLDDVSDAARDERVCAVVVWSQQRLGSLTGSRRDSTTSATRGSDAVPGADGTEPLRAAAAARSRAVRGADRGGRATAAGPPGR